MTLKCLLRPKEGCGVISDDNHASSGNTPYNKHSDFILLQQYQALYKNNTTVREDYRKALYMFCCLNSCRQDDGTRSWAGSS